MSLKKNPRYFTGKDAHRLKGNEEKQFPAKQNSKLSRSSYIHV
jgi:hypothetical protein